MFSWRNYTPSDKQYIPKGRITTINIGLLGPNYRGPNKYHHNPRAQQRPHNNNIDPLLDSRAGETHNRSNSEPERDPAPLCPRAQTGREGERYDIIPVTNTPHPTNLGNICLQNEDTDPKLVTAAGGGVQSTDCEQ